MIRTCHHCGTKNRIPGRHLVSSGRCGECHQPIPPPGEPLEADEALFDEATRESGVPVLVDFWASWCGPCRSAAPEVSKAATLLAGKALVLKVDTEANPALAQRFAVLRDGAVRWQQSGLTGHQQLVQKTLDFAG